MGKKHVKVERFAFGDAENLTSPVWRMVADTRKGDVYLNFRKELGQNVHVSLHASGKNSLKIGSERQKLAPPLLIGNRHVVFRHIHRRLTRNTKFLSEPNSKKVKFLGLPDMGRYFRLEAFYTLGASSRMTWHDDERPIVENIPAKLSHEDLNFHIGLREMPYSMENLLEIAQIKTNDIQLNFAGPNPPELEDLSLFVFQLTETDGVSTLVELPFNASVGEN